MGSLALIRKLRMNKPQLFKALFANGTWIRETLGERSVARKIMVAALPLALRYSSPHHQPKIPSVPQCGESIVHSQPLLNCHHTDGSLP
jgi:hypothetical protein